MPRKLPTQNDYNPERLRIEHNGLTLVFQSNVDHEYIHIMNPNDGRNIRKAALDGMPSLLGSFAHQDGWSYYKDAVLLTRHPLEADGFSGLYVVDHDAPAKPDLERADEGNITFLKRKEPAANVSEPPPVSESADGGAQIISLFGPGQD